MLRNKSTSSRAESPGSSAPRSAPEPALTKRQMESRMNVYAGIFAVILSYLAIGGSAVADSDDPYMVRLLGSRHECHVQHQDIDGDDLGLTDLAGPFSSRAAACSAAADLYDPDGDQ